MQASSKDMIEIAKGNLLAADVAALVNTWTAPGSWAKSIALQFMQAFPENLTAYAAGCRAGQVVPGRMFVFDTGG